MVLSGGNNVATGQKTWLKIGLIITMAVIVLSLHYFTAPQLRYQHALYRMLFYIPLILGTFWFGIRGASSIAVFISLFYIPFVIHHWKNFSIDDFSRVLEGILFIVIASLLGYLVEKERRRHQALLRAESLAAVGKAVSEIAHDMKTPLVAIGGFSRRLAKYLEKNHANRKELDIVIRETTRLETMVLEMLDFGKELEIHPADVSLNTIVEEAIGVARPMAEASGVELCVETDRNLVEFPMDGPRIKQVLLNLISNSIQASTPGNKVTIKTESSNGHVLLQVSDQGCGISLEDRDKIFDPFFSKKKDGTGLGLAIVKKIVEAHDANISVQSNKPQGTTITIAFVR